MLTENDYQYMIENSEARVIVTTKESKVAKLRTPHLCYKLFADNGLENLMHNASPQRDAFQTGDENIAFWLYSSGSTGRPKGVPHRHIDMIHSADNYGKKVLGITEDDICFSVSKLFFFYFQHAGRRETGNLRARGARL